MAANDGTAVYAVTWMQDLERVWFEVKFREKVGKDWLVAYTMMRSLIWEILACVMKGWVGREKVMILVTKCLFTPASGPTVMLVPRLLG